MEKIITCVVGGIFQGLAVSLIIKNQLQIKDKRRYNILFILISIYGVISLLFIANRFRFLLFVTILSLLLYYILNVRNKNVIIYAFNTLVLLSVSEIIATPILILTGVGSTQIVNNYIVNLFANILISMLSILIINLKPVQKVLNFSLEFFNKYPKLINYLYIFVISLYLITLRNGLNSELKSNYYVNVFIIIFFIIILYIFIKNELKSEQLKETNQQMISYVSKYEKIITEQGKANHEFKNQLMVIRGYAQMKSDKLIEYIDSIVEDSKKGHSSYLISQLNKFPDGGIKGLLYYKLSIMEDEKIKYEITVDDHVKRKLNSLDTTNYKNITKVLGVLLDNAIDASKQSKNKKIIISVIKDKSKVIFEIYNTYKGTLDITKIGTGYTSKGNGHGYGLRLVKDIIDNDNSLSINNSLEDIYYISSLEVRIKNKRKSK